MIVTYTIASLTSNPAVGSAIATPAGRGAAAVSSPERKTAQSSSIRPALSGGRVRNDDGSREKREKRNERRDLHCYCGCGERMRRRKRESAGLVEWCW